MVIPSPGRSAIMKISNFNNNKANIMIVEDEMEVAKNIREQLDKIGYNVTAIVSKGEDAVKWLEELEPQPDLVLMDIHLPGPMDGIDAAEKIRKLFNIPLIYLTAFADSETLERSRITEPFGYILKPFEPKALKSTIEIALYKHRMETRLKESESRFRTLAEFAPVGIFQTDINGNCIYVNEKWCKITGLSPVQAIGHGWSERLHPEDQQSVAFQWEQMAGRGEKFALEYRFQTLYGKVAWVFGQAVALEDGKGTRTGYMGTIIDITDRKRLEEKLLTAKKLESLGILAGGIAHDFNNLLSVIMGNITMVKDEVAQQKDLYRMLTTAERSSCEAAALAQKLTTFSKGGWLQKKKVFLSQILRISIDQVLTGTECSTKIDLAPGLSSIDGDEGQLVQVFDNILSNSVDSIKERLESADGHNGSGNIFIKAENRVMSGEEPQQLKPGKYVRVTIADNGTGIPPEHLGKVFDPYFSTKNISSRKGMGLGLAICYSILTKHEGSIRIESRVGEGTTVELYLPSYLEVTHMPGDNEEIREGEMMGTKIMVVDDEPNLLDITSCMLDKMGYRVEVFKEGLTALEAYKNAKETEPFAVVLVDLIIKKGIGGREFLSHLRQFDPHAKAIAISGSVDTNTTDLKKEGFIDVLLKPYRFKELEKVLAEALSRNKE